MNEYINTIKHFETKEAKRYWVRALNVSNSIKGYLYVYFNLTNGSN